LFYDVKKIATTDAGGSPVIATIDIDDIKAFGNDALTEEIEFVFGHRDPNVTLLSREDIGFSGYYNPKRAYRGHSNHGIDDRNIGTWMKEISKTILRLKSPQNISSIDYLHKELVGGNCTKELWLCGLRRFIAIWRRLKTIFFGLLISLAPTQRLRTQIATTF
jgi:hypothetical protein